MTKFSNQIYWSVFYDAKTDKLYMKQVQLADTLPYDKRVELVQAIDQQAKANNCEQVRFGYYNITYNLPF